METISDLDSTRNASSGCISVVSGSIPRDYLCARMVCEPFGDRIDITSFDEVDRSVCLEIDEDGGIHSGLPQSLNLTESKRIHHLSNKVRSA